MVCACKNTGLCETGVGLASLTVHISGCKNFRTKALKGFKSPSKAVGRSVFKLP